MSVRNLTNNGKNLSSSDEGMQTESSLLSTSSERRNPFLGSGEEDEGLLEPENSSQELLHNDSSGSIRFQAANNSGASHFADHGGEGVGGVVQQQPVSDYKGYYSKNSPANAGGVPDNTRLNSAKGLPSSTSLNTGLSANDIMSPPEYDRYPLVSSRISSMAQMPNPNKYTHGLNSSSPGNASDSSISSNPFLGEQDFSPFGGYPASSFPLLMEEKEDDDYLHNPDPEEEARLDKKRFVIDFKHMSRRSFGGLIGILLLFLGMLVVFVVIPAVTFTGRRGTQVISRLTDYQYPQLSAIRTALVDPDTPSSVLTRRALDGSQWSLAFSDEFNANGRTFYEGDDQFWTAVDLNYAATRDLEWYSPDAVTTNNGTLQLRMDAFRSHDLYYRSGMLQSWNKLCFTQGALEISANLPNYGRVTGLWPGLWTAGNLGRPGYLASTEGVWPYSYESCDAGITPNQSSPDGISYLPGQKLSVCTCDGESHPNQGVGRGAPEIDVLEAEADTTLGVGVASQSLQIAPFDIWYIPDYEFIEVYNFTTTSMNTYCGGPFQQAVSAITTLNTTWYEFGPDAGKFQKYSYEYLNDNDNGYIRWFVGDVPTYTIYAKALHPNGNIGWRRISKEPMSIILNLGISTNWAYIDWQFLFFPVTMSVDYVRIYQPNDSISITCEPDGYPTQDYINAHMNAYYNVNLTSWEEAGYSFPKNILTGDCTSSRFQLSSNDGQHSNSN
ncbi:hypothetical protein HG535_0B02360 [Zygotorulaspora mrakii]|uniref:GH16 domain-containing protein n=1 Tax=Zygotorulaspora mrakii TaxID=42260 RepID=A0A7H9AYG3_ZYGMR|nr:uncharacterized protein HG535_0B02360 [Zygotorulaspora mrakii]QLG71197.1 hypothetical protein HG535_0B02360 [Zygotorulaspora mrakii]